MSQAYRCPLLRCPASPDTPQEGGARWKKTAIAVKKTHSIGGPILFSGNNLLMFNDVAESRSSKANREGKRTEGEHFPATRLFGDRKSLKATDRLNPDFPPDWR